MLLIATVLKTHVKHRSSPRVGSAACVPGSNAVDVTMTLLVTRDPQASSLPDHSRPRVV